MSAQGFVYAIESGDAVKIGFAKDPVRRLSELNVGSPGAHRLIGFLSGMKSDEKFIHRSCAKLRIRGEWFRNEGIVREIVSTFPPYEPKPALVAGLSAVRSGRMYTADSPLSQYFRDNGENASTLAAKMGCAVTTITRPLRGDRKASTDLAIDVERATGGRVTASAFLSDCLAARKRASVSKDAPATGAAA